MVTSGVSFDLHVPNPSNSILAVHTPFLPPLGAIGVLCGGFLVIWSTREHARLVINSEVLIEKYNIFNKFRDGMHYVASEKQRGL